MPNFSFVAVDPQGRSSTGVLSADSRTAALDAVSSRGLMPVRIEARDESAVAAPAIRPGRASRLSAAQIESFTRELANLLAGGVPLSRALHVLRREATSPAARAQWSAVHDDVVGGVSLAEALNRWPASFPPVYVAMVRAGEAGGFLDVVLAQITEFRARESELKGKVKSAMIYPALLAVMAVGVIVFLLTFFIPRFTGIFASFGADLPWLTRAILSASAGVTRYGPVIAVALGILFVVLRRAATSDSGRRTLERLWLKMPGVGTVLSRFALVRFTRMLGTLLGAGVSLEVALRMAKDSIGYQTLADATQEALEEVRRGQPLSRSLAATPQLFPPAVIEMVAVAEETGRLDKELVRLAVTYEADLDRRLRTIVALVPPLMLFAMAAFIGAIVIGMLLPIFTLQDLIH